MNLRRNSNNNYNKNKNNKNKNKNNNNTVNRSPIIIPKASDALPLPLYLTNGIFLTLFFSVTYFLLHRWRDKIRSSIPLHAVTVTELTAILLLIASFIYLLGFFGIYFVQSFIATSRTYDDTFPLPHDVVPNPNPKPKPMDIKPNSFLSQHDVVSKPKPNSVTNSFISEPKPNIKPNCVTNGYNNIISKEDEEIVKSVINGTVSSYSLESRLGDCNRAAAIRREAVERKTGRSVRGLPLQGFDYKSILGQCCEMPIGYVQIPVGIAGPLLLNGGEYMVPMATTEGCLVASTNRGCKAVFGSGGATAVLLKDGMSRAPVVRFGTVARAAELKFFLEDRVNFETLSIVFNK